MYGFIGRALQGWPEYLEAGKLPAVCFLVLLLLRAFRLGEGRQETLKRYCLIAAALCICPLTAGLLMRYQTSFYDYQWIWTLVPVTATIACGGTLLWERLTESRTLSARAKGVLAAAAVLLLFLCGYGNADTRWKPQDLRAERQRAARVLAQLGGDKERICLWAPEEIMAHARGIDGNLTLAYGRNMWQEALNAYSYDMYSEAQREMYVWMEMAGREGLLDEKIGWYLRVVGEIPPQGTVLTGEEMMKNAIDLGVNRILLPGRMEEGEIAKLEDMLRAPAEKVEDYYLFRLSAGEE